MVVGGSSVSRAAEDDVFTIMWLDRNDVVAGLDEPQTTFWSEEFVAALKFAIIDSKRFEVVSALIIDDVVGLWFFVCAVKWR